MIIMPISCGICVEAVSDGPLPNIDFARDRWESMATGGAASPTLGLVNKEEKPSSEMRAKSFVSKNLFCEHPLYLEGQGLQSRWHRRKWGSRWRESTKAQ